MISVRSGLRIAAGAENAEPTTAARTADETGQKSPPAASGLRVADPAVGVAGERRLITVRTELVKLGFSRQSNRKADEGSKHPDRNAQFCLACP
jgi:hypothetical protein